MKDSYNWEIEKKNGYPSLLIWEHFQDVAYKEVTR